MVARQLYANPCISSIRKTLRGSRRHGRTICPWAKFGETTGVVRLSRRDRSVPVVAAECSRRTCRWPDASRAYRPIPASVAATCRPPDSVERLCPLTACWSERGSSGSISRTPSICTVLVPAPLTEQESTRTDTAGSRRARSCRGKCCGSRHELQSDPDPAERPIVRHRT